MDPGIDSFHPSRRIQSKTAVADFDPSLSAEVGQARLRVRCSLRMRPVFDPRRNMSRRSEATACARIRAH